MQCRLSSNYFKRSKAIRNWVISRALLIVMAHCRNKGWNKKRFALDGANDRPPKIMRIETHQWLVGRGTIECLKPSTTCINKLHEVRLLHIPNKSDLDIEVEQVGYYLKGLPSDVRNSAECVSTSWSNWVKLWSGLNVQNNRCRVFMTSSTLIVQRLTKHLR